MMRDPLPKDIERVEVQPTDTQAQAPTESIIAASNAIKYTAYVMLFFGFLYFLFVYLAPLL